MKPQLFLAALAFAGIAQAAPMVIGTDFTAVPTNTTGYNGHGGQATVFLKNFPAFTDWGVGSHIYLLNPTDSTKSCEVYAYDSQATPPWDDGSIPKQPSIVGVRFQIGNMTDLANCAPSYGSPLNIDVMVGGVHATGNRSDVNAAGVTTYYSLIVGADAPNIRTGFIGDYEPLTITPLNGQVLFVDPNSTYTYLTADGSWAKPFPNLQEADGYTGALRNSHSGTGNCPSHCPDGTKPATQIIMRGGNHHVLGSWSTPTGNGGRWANLIRVSGVAAGPNQWQGPIGITSWDGGAGSNANEIAVLDQSAGGTHDYAGGFMGADSARAAETNYWDTTLTGWNKHIEISWVKVIANPHGPNDGAPFNLDYGADDNRIVAVDASWQATTNSIGYFHCGAICGDGLRIRTFLGLLHDVGGYTTGSQPYTNHGVYIDSGLAAASDVTVAFTAIKNIWGGNSLMANASGGYGGCGGTCATGHITNMFFYGNWMDGAGKNNLTFSQARSMYAWNNEMLNAGDAAVNVSNGIDMMPNGFQAFNNDILDWDQLGGGRAAFWDQGSDGSGNWDARNNICMRRSTGTGTGPWYIVNYPSYLFTDNTWYDATSGITQTIPDSATGGQVTNPKFVGAPTNNFTLGTTSPAANYSASLLGAVPREFDFMLKPVFGTAWDGGAYERQQ